MGDLALQVGEVDLVVVDQGDPADAGRAEVERHRRAEAAGADHQRVGGSEALLAFDADVVEQDVARIAQQLVVGHGAAVASRLSSGAKRRIHAEGRDPSPSAQDDVPSRRSAQLVVASALRSTAVLLTRTVLPLRRFSAWTSWKSSGPPNSIGGLGAPLRAAVSASSFLRASSRAFSRASSFCSSTLAAHQVLVEVGLAHAQGGEHVAFGGLVEHDVGHDALGLDRGAARRVVARGGDLQRGVGGELAHRLHRALAEGLRAHDGGALVVLQGAGDDLAGRGRAFVDQHHQRHLLQRPRAGASADRNCRAARSTRARP